MKARDVMRILKISRPSLTKYVHNGKLKVTIGANGRYDYDDKSVYKILNRNVERKSVIYARVSTQKQKADLDNQITNLSAFCMSKGFIVSNIYSDIASGINFQKRKEFFLMLDEIIEGKIERVIISYKDRLSRVGFELFSHLFEQYHCEIIVANEVGNEKLDSEDIFEEIVSLLHCYSMKMYSKRRIINLKKALEIEGDENESSEG